MKTIKSQDISKGYDPYLGIIHEQKFDDAMLVTHQKLYNKVLTPQQMKELDLSKHLGEVFVVRELDNSFSAFRVIETSLGDVKKCWWKYTHGQMLFEFHGKFYEEQENRGTYKTYEYLLMSLAKREMNLKENIKNPTEK